MSRDYPTTEELERRRDREAIREINATLKEMLALQRAAAPAKQAVPVKRLAKALAASDALVSASDPTTVHAAGTAEACLRITGTWSAVEEVLMAVQALRR